MQSATTKARWLTTVGMGVLTGVKIRGAFPLKIAKAKNVKNLARFRTTFDFDGKYLSNELRYR